MKAVIQNGIRLKGVIQAPPSKSEAIRAALLLGMSGADPGKALSGYEGRAVCDDIAAAINAGRAIKDGSCRAEVGASAALLRMLLPCLLALFGKAEITASPSLYERGLVELEACLGVELSPKGGLLRVRKKLCPGSFTVDCSRSSQFLSGMLLALPLLKEESRITVPGRVVSSRYADMTIRTASRFGASYDLKTVTDGCTVCAAPAAYRAPEPYVELDGGRFGYVGGDWSYAAVFFAANHMGSDAAVMGLSENSLQADSACMSAFGLPQADISQMPDLLPPLAAAACACPHYSRFTGTARLRYKESSRAYAMAEMIRDLGGSAAADEDSLTVEGGKKLKGGACRVYGDHRLVMAAAILAGICESPVVIDDAECVAKSAPDFWNDYKNLGGEYEFIW